ncbi:hypothetical protein COU53_03425 [Candidatus Pacearchaeota archaeon CG10_big_fil_rev_8_21_14_0_10_30_48]|nr:MAG: hypothetical protein COU53_03425 [Candidatus Pacearchaeota archaeon CG10_big_fil_rev_8_21_14_0_10_30_48]
MGISFIPSARNGLSEDELRAYALEIVQKEHRTPKRFRDYVLGKVRKEYFKFSPDEMKEIVREIPKLKDFAKPLKSGRISNKRLYEFISHIGITEDYIPILEKEELKPALNKAYKNIIGEERPVFLPKKPNLSGAVVLEKLLDILRD